MENSAKEHELEVSLTMIHREDEKLYGLFADVFGEDAAEDMPETADAIDNHLLHCLRYCGKRVDASKIYEIIIAISSMKDYEERFRTADEAWPDDPEAWACDHPDMANAL